MPSHRYEIGERVVASVHGTGTPRRGTVVATLGGVVSGYVWNGEPRYMVRFDGDRGASGPCLVLSPKASDAA